MAAIRKKLFIPSWLLPPALSRPYLSGTVLFKVTHDLSAVKSRRHLVVSPRCFIPPYFSQLTAPRNELDSRLLWHAFLLLFFSPLWLVLLSLCYRLLFFYLASNCWHSSRSLPSVLIYLWCFYTTTTPKCFCWALCCGLCADISICLLGISAQTIHWHLQFNKPEKQIFSSQVHSALFPYFSHLGEWHNHHLESSLIPFSLSPHKYSPPASLISLIFKYTWTLSTHVPLHFHHASSRYRAVLEECNPCGPPEIITLKRRPQRGHIL